MGKPNPKKLAKKRRKESERRRERPASLAYHGQKYHTDALVPLHMATETGILEADALSQRGLVDRDVAAALTELILAIRRGQVDFDTMEFRATAAGEAPTLVSTMILLRWKGHFQLAPRPSQDTLVGVLRSILGSLEIRTTAGSESRAFIAYLTGFLGSVGVRPRLVKNAGLRADDEEDDEPDDDDESIVDAEDSSAPLAEPQPRRGDSQ